MIKVYLFILLLLCSHLKMFAFDGVEDKTTRPNIILFLSDDHGADDLGALGNKDVSTPVIDQLASEGLLFTSAFAAASICAPSRSVIYTGLYPHRNGGHQQSGQISNGIKTLPVYLKSQGYRVALAGKTHIKPVSAFPFEYMELGEVPEFLRSVDQQPFCLIISYFTPHEPYFNKKKGVSSNELQPKKWLPDTPETRKLTAASYDNVENLDNEVGTSLFWIEKIGVPENTVQIYTSDHGSGLPFAKWTLYEPGLHVPLIVKWDGIVKPGSRSDALVSLVDLLPTFLDITRTEIPDDLDGKSFLPVLKGKTNNLHDYVFAAYTNQEVKDGNRYPIRTVRGDRYKLIVNFNHKEPFSIRNTTRPDPRAVIDGYKVLKSWENAASRDSFAKKRHQQFLHRPKFELYDLKNDPYELNNLYGLKSYSEVQKELLEEMKNWLLQQNDPVANEL